MATKKTSAEVTPQDRLSQGCAAQEGVLGMIGRLRAQVAAGLITLSPDEMHEIVALSGQVHADAQDLLRLAQDKLIQVLQEQPAQEPSAPLGADDLGAQQGDGGAVQQGTAQEAKPVPAQIADIWTAISGLEEMQRQSSQQVMELTQQRDAAERGLQQAEAARQEAEAARLDAERDAADLGRSLDSQAQSLQIVLGERDDLRVRAERAEAHVLELQQDQSDQLAQAEDRGRLKAIAEMRQEEGEGLTIDRQESQELTEEEARPGRASRRASGTRRGAAPVHRAPPRIGGDMALPGRDPQEGLGNVV